MATLAYAFLLTLSSFSDPLRRWLLRYYCHRTGEHEAHAKAPLYRLRSALIPIRILKGNLEMGKAG